MFGDERAEKFRQVMVAVDKINRRWGKDTVRFAIANLEGRCVTKFEKRSPRYTTRIEEVLTIH
jgi:DNA polymerase V